MSSSIPYQEIASTTVLRQMQTKMKISKASCCANLESRSRSLLPVLGSYFFGCETQHLISASTYSFYRSVIRLLCDNFSFSMLKVLITTPTNKFKMKSDPTIMNKPKNRMQPGFRFRSGTQSILFESTTENITSSQPSVVIMPNMEIIALSTSSKLSSQFTQSPPQFQQSH